MANLNKVRVQLLDAVSGAVLEEVDVLTSADAVTFADGQTFQQKLDAGLLKGAKGDAGAQGIQGPKGDTGAQGLKGDKGDAGEQGVKGADGKTWHVSAAVPANSLGVIGDMHLNTATFDIREKTAATVWTLRGNIKGATGAQGVKGDTGAKGQDGDNVKFGTSLATASDVKLFLKKV